MVAEVELPLQAVLKAKRSAAVHNTSSNQLQLMLSPLHLEGTPSPSRLGELKPRFNWVRHPLIAMYSLQTASSDPRKSLVMQELMWESVGALPVRPSLLRCCALLPCVAATLLCAVALSLCGCGSWTEGALVVSPAEAASNHAASVAEAACFPAGLLQCWRACLALSARTVPVVCSRCTLTNMQGCESESDQLL